MFKFSNYMSTHQVRDMLNHGFNWLRITGSANVVADAAKIIGKTPRTVEAYRAKSDSRQIGADDLLKIFAEVISKFAQMPQNPVMPITVFDGAGQLSVRVHSVFSAAFLADLEGGTGYWKITDGVYMPVDHRQLPERIQRKSDLRRLLHSRAVSVDEACRALDCCPYALVAMQLDSPLVDVAAPSVEALLALNAVAAEQMGEAA